MVAEGGGNGEKRAMMANNEFQVKYPPMSSRQRTKTNHYVMISMATDLLGIRRESLTPSPSVLGSALLFVQIGIRRCERHYVFVCYGGTDDRYGPGRGEF